MVSDDEGQRSWSGDDLVELRKKQLDEAEARFGRSSAERRQAREELLVAINNAAAARGDIYLIPYRLKNRYTAAGPRLLVQNGGTLLCLQSREHGSDTKMIVFNFDHCYAATFSPPPEDLLHHHIWGKLGLGWWGTATVGNSPLMRLYADMNGIDLAKHYIFYVKDYVFHAVAWGFTELLISEKDYWKVEQALGGVPWHLLGSGEIFPLGLSEGGG